MADKYICLMCFKEYGSIEECFICEDKHKLKEDDFYLKWLDKENFRKLQQAGRHPYQAKL